MTALKRFGWVVPAAAFAVGAWALAPGGEALTANIPAPAVTGQAPAVAGLEIVDGQGWQAMADNLSNDVSVPKKRPGKDSKTGTTAK